MYGKFRISQGIFLQLSSEHLYAVFFGLKTLIPPGPSVSVALINISLQKAFCMTVLNLVIIPLYLCIK